MFHVEHTTPEDTRCSTWNGARAGARTSRTNSGPVDSAPLRRPADRHVPRGTSVLASPPGGRATAGTRRRRLPLIANYPTGHHVGHPHSPDGAAQRRSRRRWATDAPAPHTPLADVRGESGSKERAPHGTTASCPNPPMRASAREGRRNRCPGPRCATSQGRRQCGPRTPPTHADPRCAASRHGLIAGRPRPPGRSQRPARTRPSARPASGGGAGGSPRRRQKSGRLAGMPSRRGYLDGHGRSNTKEQ